MIEVNLLNKIKNLLQEGKAIRGLEMTQDEKVIAKNFNFLTLKPIIYVANVSDADLMDLDSCEYYQRVKNFAASENSVTLYYYI